jgi:hypothetical protein
MSPVFEGRVMLPEEQEQVYEELLEFERARYLHPFFSFLHVLRCAWSRANRLMRE